MSDKPSKENPFYQHSENTTAFLGGITFTAMILLLEFSTNLIYSEILIPGTAIISILFIMSTVGTLKMKIDNDIKDNTKFPEFVQTCGRAGFFGMMVILPLLIVEFSLIGTIVIIAVEVFLIIMFLYSARISK